MGAELGVNLAMALHAMTDPSHYETVPPDRDAFALAHATRSSSLFHRMVQTSGDSTFVASTSNAEI